MNPAALLRGKMTYTGGALAILAGLSEIFGAIQGAATIPGASCLSILPQIPTYDGFWMLAGGIVAIGIRRAMDQQNKGAEEQLRTALAEILTEMEKRKEPKP